MHRYLAVSWDARQRTQRDVVARILRLTEERLPSFERLFLRDGLSVSYVPDPRGVFIPTPLASAKGIVLGRLFHHDTAEDQIPRRVEFDAQESALLLATSGRRLICSYWGAYVAFLHDVVKMETHVLPSPTGAIPCFYTEHLGVRVFFSSAADWLELGLQALSVNWRYVSAFLAQAFLQPTETGIAEISSVRPGECWHLCAGRPVRRELLWDLPKLSVDASIDELEPAVVQARSAIRMSVGAWASCYPRIVLLFSGGVDSSVVLASLLRAPAMPSITCLHYFDHDSVCDERSFARSAIDGCRRTTGKDCEYVEIERQPDIPDLASVLDLTPSACPAPSLFPYLSRHTHLEQLRKRDAVLFTGVGGDDIFYSDTDQSPAVDYVHSRGLGRDLLRVVYEDARNGGRASFVATLWRAISQGLLHPRRGYSPLISESSFVAPEIFDTFRSTGADYLNPVWLQGDVDLPPGKLRHIESMYMSRPLTDPYGRPGDLLWTMPLLSQPILELFARIPTHILAAQGSNRIVARRAFSSDLPPSWFARRSKGFGDPYVMKVLRRHKPFFKELLLDGVLVQNKFLNRAKIEEFFRLADERRTPGSSELICSHADLEIWLRSWQSIARNFTHVAG